MLRAGYYTIMICTIELLDSNPNQYSDDGAEFLTILLPSVCSKTTTLLMSMRWLLK